MCTNNSCSCFLLPLHIYKYFAFVYNLVYSYFLSDLWLYVTHNCDVLKLLAESNESLRNTKSMKLLAEKLPYRVKIQQNNNSSRDQIIKSEEEKALKDVKG